MIKKILENKDKNLLGFTLIELLAVIVILAIIVLIATPIVLNIIEDSKKSAFVQTGNGIVDAAEYYYMNEMSDGVKPTENKVFIFDESKRNIEGLEFDGEIPKEGTLTVDVNGKVELVAHNNQYCITKGYEDDEVTIKHYDGDCKIPPICTLVNAADNSGTITPGDKYQCKVKGDMEPGFEDGYYFYVLSLNEEGTTNLIMDRNICEDGTVATTEKICDVEYNSSGDAVGVGPVTAMTYLNEATSSWKDELALNITYNDEGGNFTNFNITGKARMPYKSEVSDYDGTNAYLYDNLRLSCYDNQYAYNKVSCEVAGHIVGVDVEGITHIDGIQGYWTLSSTTDESRHAWYVDFRGYVQVDIVGIGNHPWGVRPVITLEI